jgi:DNA (cytosine-5)-methyltransferase 1
MVFQSVYARLADMNMLKKIDYLPFLESCWQEHLAPREPNAPTVISTFAGCGGSSLGYSMAGFRELLAIEWNDNAVATFKLNFPDVPVYHGDIAKISVEQVLQMTGLKVGELDVFDGSPPCQGFSTAGKREFSDDRNQLFLEFSRLLRGLQPKVFVMENVSGMVKGKMKIIFAEILRELKSCGYRVSVKLLNAMYFNVPQSRERLIFIGVRNDLDIQPSHPEAESGQIVVRDAWKDCNDSLGKKITDYELEIWKATPAGKSMAIGSMKVLKANRYFTSKKLSFNAISNTIAKSMGSAILHPDEPRKISLGELKRLASYPDEFKFTDYRNGWTRIGNSVPPLFMRSIARYIRQSILHSSQS